MSYQELASLLNYDPKSGKFTWRVHQHKLRAGSQAGHKASRDGYWRFWFRGKCFQGHRVAWFIMTGELPEQVDHKNRVRDDNRFTNLRAATAAQNCANRVGRRHGLKGVARLPNGRFQAAFMHAGRGEYLGSFDTEEEAHDAYAARAHAVLGEFACVS